MSRFKFLMPCEEANHTCDKTQYKEASLWEKVKLNFHLIYCRACREYTSTNSKLTKIVSKSKLECLDSDCKEKMKKDLEIAIKETHF